VLDVETLTRLRAYEDPVAGVREEFVDLVLDGTPTLGVLSKPIGTAGPAGWVVCHSFGLEQMNLDRVDVLVGRAVAAAGFPVLRFDAPGYGDSARRGEPVDVGSHLDASLEAVAFMAAVDGVERVGVMGARFGGMLAAEVADRLDLPLLIMWQPFVTGADFLRSSLQTVFLTERLRRSSGGSGGLLADLAGQGWSDVNGFVLTRDAYDAVSAVDLTERVRRFRGTALVVGITEDGSVGPDATRVAAHLRSLGATCEEAAVTDPWAKIFGQHQFRSLPGGETEVDMQVEVSKGLTEVVARWVVTQA